MPDFYTAKDIGVSISGAVCGAQSFSVSFDYPVTPIFQLGSVTNCGVMQAPGRGTATLTVLGDVPVVTGTWAEIMVDDTLTVACPLFGLSGAACTGVTFTGRAGSPPSATYTFTGTGFTTAASAAPGACGCGVATVDITGPQAAYTVTASSTVSFLEEFGNAALLGMSIEQPRVTATLEYYVGSAGINVVTIGTMSLALDETLKSAEGGRGSVGGFATYSISFFGGSEGSLTGGLTIS